MADLVIDPTAIGAHLGAARERREDLNRQAEHLEKVIAWLETGAELFGSDSPPELPPAAPAQPIQLDPPPAEAPVEPAPEPQRTVAGPPHVRAGDRDMQAKIVSAVLKAGRAVSQDDLVNATGLPKEQLRPQLRALVDAGTIHAFGSTRARRYSKGAEHELHSDGRKRREAGVARNATRVADGLARVVFRDKVAKAIAGAPGLTAIQISCQLEADVDDVDEACSWLVEHRQARQENDGYVRQTARRARLRAA